MAVLREVSRPEAGPPLAWHPVSTRLNKGAEVEGPQCCLPAPREAERGAGSVAALFAKAQPRAVSAAAAEEEAKGAEPASPGAAAATPAKRALAGAAQQSPASSAKRAKHTPPPKGQRSVAAFFAKS